jgi:hypothetical protein
LKGIEERMKNMKEIVHQTFAVAIKTENGEKYLSADTDEESFYHDDLFYANLYTHLGFITLSENEYIVRVEYDKQGLPYVASDEKEILELEIERLTPIAAKAEKDYRELYFMLDAKKNKLLDLLLKIKNQK